MFPEKGREAGKRHRSPSQSDSREILVELPLANHAILYSNFHHTVPHDLAEKKNPWINLEAAAWTLLGVCRPCPGHSSHTLDFRLTKYCQTIFLKKSGNIFS